MGNRADESPATPEDDLLDMLFGMFVSDLLPWSAEEILAFNDLNGEDGLDVNNPDEQGKV